MKSLFLNILLFVSFASFATDISALKALASDPVEVKNLKPHKNIMVLIKTNHGDIQVELFEKKAPVSVKNFLNYVDQKLYNGTIFHRVISNFMIQGGGFLPNFQERKAFAPIKNEADNGLDNTRGTLAMARTSEVNSATNQFFINVNDNHFLNHRSKNPQGYGYAVFGNVTSGMDVVDKIKSQSTTSKMGYDDVPSKDIIINSIERL